MLDKALVKVLEWFIPTVYAANDYGPVAPKDYSTFTNKLGQIVKDLGMPIGATILLVSLIVLSAELAMSRGNPQKRAEVMSGIGYALIAGIILGAVFFIAGAAIGIGQYFSQ
jgi:hypothetical protein